MPSEGIANHTLTRKNNLQYLSLDFLFHALVHLELDAGAPTENKNKSRIISQCMQVAIFKTVLAKRCNNFRTQTATAY